MGRLFALFLLLSIVPLALVAQWSVGAASEALTKETERHVRSAAVSNESSIRAAISGAADNLGPWSSRLTVVDALAKGAVSPQDRRLLGVNLRQLGTGAIGGKAFVTDPRGRLIIARPSTSAPQGTDLSSEQGIAAPGVGTDVRLGCVHEPGHECEACVGDRRPDPRSVPTLARFRGRRLQGRRFQSFVELLARSQNVSLTLTDRRGTVLGDSDGPLRRGASRTADPLVAAALRGHSGVRERKLKGVDGFVAFEPVKGLGWALRAAVPTKSALEAIGDLRSTVLERLGLLAVVLLLGLAVLVWTLRGERRAEEELHRARDEAERANRPSASFSRV